MTESRGPLKKTPLHALHLELGGKMVPFAGYDMPVQYPMGILAEHQHTRRQAGLFDVSHMGQLRIAGDDPAGALEALVTNDLRKLDAGQIAYNLLTNERGGIRDDLMVTQAGDHLHVVVNAACKDADFAHIRDGIAKGYEVDMLDDLALLALQGPMAAEVLGRHAADATRLVFMESAIVDIGGTSCRISRSGYTGEDGFEISVPAARAEDLARLLLGAAEVKPIGLGARDSLRLEAGLCLYGHDIDETTTPVEAGLTWAVGKRRREEGGFPGADVIVKQIREGAPRKRVGLLPEGRAPAREGTEIRDAAGAALGTVTSGGFGPTVGGPVAMGYVAAAAAKAGTELALVVRDKPRPAKVAKMPFVPHNYHRG